MPLCVGAGAYLRVVGRRGLESGDHILAERPVGGRLPRSPQFVVAGDARADVHDFEARARAAVRERGVCCDGL